jgi:hypothetical protein
MSAETETVAEKVARLAFEKGVPRDTILAAIYAGLGEAEIIAADSGKLLYLHPRRYGRRAAEPVTATEPPVAVTKYEPIRG